MAKRTPAKFQVGETVTVSRGQPRYTVRKVRRSKGGGVFGVGGSLEYELYPADGLMVAKEGELKRLNPVEPAHNPEPFLSALLTGAGLTAGASAFNALKDGAKNPRRNLTLPERRFLRRIRPGLVYTATGRDNELVASLMQQGHLYGVFTPRSAGRPQVKKFWKGPARPGQTETNQVSSRNPARDLYGVFIGSKWAMTTNRREAIKFAKEHKGEIRIIRGGAVGYGRPSSWDAPTFRVSSELLADYRGGEQQNHSSRNPAFAIGDLVRFPALDTVATIKDVEKGGLFGSTKYKIEYEEKDGDNKTAMVPARAIRRLNPAGNPRSHYEPCPGCGKRVLPPRGVSEFACRWCGSRLQNSP